MNNICSVCAGLPLSSGKICICNGIGTQDAETNGLRKYVFYLEETLNKIFEIIKDRNAYSG